MFVASKFAGVLAANQLHVFSFSTVNHSKKLHKKHSIKGRTHRVRQFHWACIASSDCWVRVHTICCAFIDSKVAFLAPWRVRLFSHSHACKTPICKTTSQGTAADQPYYTHSTISGRSPLWSMTSSIWSWNGFRFKLWCLFTPNLLYPPWGYVVVAQVWLLEQHSYALRVYCWATVQGLQLVCGVSHSASYYV